MSIKVNQWQKRPLLLLAEQTQCVLSTVSDGKRNCGTGERLQQACSKPDEADMSVQILLNNITITITVIDGHCD